MLNAVLQPRNCRNNFGLGYSPFARHYLENHYCFLFLQVLRCFSSLSSPPLRDDRSSICRVAPFGNLRIKARLQLPVAYRSLPRPSSPMSAKASTTYPSFVPVIFLLRTDYHATVIQRLPLSQLTYLLVDFIPHCQRTIKKSKSITSLYQHTLSPNLPSRLPAVSSRKRGQNSEKLPIPVKTLTHFFSTFFFDPRCYPFVEIFCLPFQLLPRGKVVQRYDQFLYTQALHKKFCRKIYQKKQRSW